MLPFCYDIKAPPKNAFGRWRFSLGKCRLTSAFTDSHFLRRIVWHGQLLHQSFLRGDFFSLVFNFLKSDAERISICDSGILVMRMK